MIYSQTKNTRSPYISKCQYNAEERSNVHCSEHVT